MGLILYRLVDGGSGCSGGAWNGGGGRGAGGNGGGGGDGDSGGGGGSSFETSRLHKDSHASCSFFPLENLHARVAWWLSVTSGSCGFLLGGVCVCVCVCVCMCGCVQSLECAMVENAIWTYLCNDP